MCRKVAMAKLTGKEEVEIWGDGEQTRSFMHIDDCLEGVYRLMMSDCSAPLNLGRDRMVTINELAQIAAHAAGIEIEKVHIDGPMGVRGRNSDNTKLREVLGWDPKIALEEGIAQTYVWIEDQLRAKLEADGVLAGDGASAEPVAESA
jgi:nucleoside-diphosphate-sugar epimerase